MLSEKFVSIRVCLTLAAALWLQSFVVCGASNTWRPTGSLTEARSGSAVVVLADGSVLFTGGAGPSGALATTELFTANGKFSLGTSMQVARANHAAVVLFDGRVLVASGTTLGGAITNSAELYEPSTTTWTTVPEGMSVPRSGETATLLADGRVLVAGGQSASGPTNTLEIFSPDIGTFSAVVSGTLSAIREQHAAALLPGTVELVAGGSDGDAALRSVDIYDPSSGTISSAEAMSSPRAGLSATTLLDGTVLLAAGNNGSADLNTAEIYDPVASTFSLASNLTTARSGHFAVLLPSNNEVLITGGTSGSAAHVSANAPTTLKLSSLTPASVTFGTTGPVNFSATLTRNDTTSAVSGAAVTFQFDGTQAGSSIINANGAASISYNTSSLAAGNHNVQAYPVEPLNFGFR